MEILYYIVLGGLAGWLASIVMKTNAQMGIIANVVVGIVGAVIGGFIFGLLGADTDGSFLYSLIVAFVGAVILLWLVKQVKRS